MDLHAFVSAVSRGFRRRRMERFAREFGLTEQTRILDVGGTPDCWRLLRVRPRVTLLNMPRAKDELGEGYLWVAGDGRALPFRDGAFDVVFSNSAIEHVGSAASQEAFAREAARVGRGFWIQTPNRWFPVEQHLLTPCIHWLPKRWQRAVVPRCNVWSALARVTPDRRRFYIQHFLADVRLLGPGEVRALFPAARLVRERFCGITKSLIACRRESPARELPSPAAREK
ncbi:MAG: class I SAM-dependent methyltransferase [Acidobacteriia bacterium]|nr:class I SAM-dependent methyltransferase [Terriglobia bacterium]